MADKQTKSEETAKRLLRMKRGDSFKVPSNGDRIGVLKVAGALKLAGTLDIKIHTHKDGSGYAVVAL